MKKDLLEKVDKIDLSALETSISLLKKINQTKPQEMERKKVLVLKENLVLEIDLQEMERKKVLVLKENQVFQKKKNLDHLALQIIQNILEKNHQMTILPIKKKKALVLRVRKNLKAEIVDQKTLVLKNTVKKDQSLKTF
jgi:hypothetical protein